MKVNIKINGQALSVEVSVEVYECMDAARRKSENLYHEKRRHWDAREFDEYIAATEGRLPYRETPEEQVCRMETWDELLSVLEGCTEAQRRRFLLYALDGFSYAEIAQLCSCSKTAVHFSIEAVRKKFRNFFEKTP